MASSAFTRAVIRNAGGQCEVLGCDAVATSAHHFLKQSTWPEYRDDPDNGMATCGPDHSEIERRLRGGEDATEMYPKGRYQVMLDKSERESANKP